MINSEIDENQLEGTVKTVLPSGSETVMQVEVGKDIFNVLMQHEVDFNAGESVNLYIPPESILLYNSQEKLISV